MEIATAKIGIELGDANTRSPSESKSLQSHIDRSSLFELDTDRFSECLQAIVPLHNCGGNMESSHISSSYLRADSPHWVSSHRITRPENEVSQSPLEKTERCTEPPPLDQRRSVYGACAPLPIRESIAEAGDRPCSHVEGGRESNRRDRLQDSSEDWYDVGGFDRESAARFLQLLEHQQTQWLTVPNNNFQLPLPKLPG